MSFLTNRINNLQLEYVMCMRITWPLNSKSIIKLIFSLCLHFGLARFQSNRVRISEGLLYNYYIDLSLPNAFQWARCSTVHLYTLQDLCPCTNGVYVMCVHVIFVHVMYVCSCTCTCYLCTCYLCTCDIHVHMYLRVMCLHVMYISMYMLSV